MKLIVSSAILLTVAIASAWADAAEGKAVYDSKCKMCHGADGKGNPTMVKSMGVKPIAGADEAATKEAVTKGKAKMKPMRKKSKKSSISPTPAVAIIFH